MSICPPCPVCDAPATDEFLRREGVPVHQHTLMSNRQAAQAIARGSLGMRVCGQCGFVFNGCFDAGLLDYGATYDNSQTCSHAFDRYLDEIADHLIGQCGVRQARIVEVGCGKGTFLRKLVADPADGNQAVGFDPSYLGPASEFSGRLRFAKQFFDGTGMDIVPDVVVCRHVIEHIERPVAFLQTIGAALQAAGTSHARVFFETPCIEWILRNQVVWDFFYEHCSLFSGASLAWTFRRAGFEVVSTRHLFGGQYLWLEAQWSSKSRPSTTAETLAAGAIPHLARQFAATESALRTTWSEQTQRCRRSGHIALWGGGAKGVTFANLVDPDVTWLDCVVDVNPRKQGKFLPGTGHPLVAPDQLNDRGVATAFVLNGNYLAEITGTLAALDSRVAVVDLMGDSGAGRAEPASLVGL